MRASVVAARGLSSCGSRVLERRLSSRGAWAQLLWGVWDLPGSGLKPVSPALAGGFLTTVPPGKPSVLSFASQIRHHLLQEGFLLNLLYPPLLLYLSSHPLTFLLLSLDEELQEGRDGVSFLIFQATIVELGY